MGKKMKTTKEKLEEESVKEFLLNGFEKASLRQIVRNAGLTTGAFYKYYTSKEEMFYSIIDPIVLGLKEKYNTYVELLKNLPKPYKTSDMIRVTHAGVLDLFNYVYDKKAHFYILVNKATGTKYENFIDLCVREEYNATVDFVKANSDQNLPIRINDEFVCQMIITGRTRAIFDIVFQSEDREDAIDKIRRLEEYFTAGFEHYWKYMIENHKNNMN